MISVAHAAEGKNFSNLDQAPAQQEILRRVSGLVKTFYPNAKVTVTSEKLNFEYRVQPHQSVRSNQIERGPRTGGILGELSFEPDLSESSAKSTASPSSMVYNVAPVEINEYDYLTRKQTVKLKFAPKIMLVRISYPPDVATDFLEELKAIISEVSSKKTTENTASAKPSAKDTETLQPTATSVKHNREAAKLYFWKATRGNDTVYLLGTIHLAPPSLYPLPPKIEAAFSESKALVVEIAIDRRKVDQSKVDALVEKSGKYISPDCLSKHLSKETKKIFDEYLAWSGESWAMYNPYKAWYVREMISSSVPRRGDLSKLKKALGLDMHFLKKATETKKSVYEFETIDFQIALNSKFTEAVQDKLLRLALLSIKNTEAEMSKIFSAWKAGDVDGMKHTIDSSLNDDPELNTFSKALLDDRNIGMVAKLDNFVKIGGTPIFVAVGAAHMCGDKGLVNLLKTKGFEVTQVVSDTETTLVKPR